MAVGPDVASGVENAPVCFISVGNLPLPDLTVIFASEMFAQLQTGLRFNGSVPPSV